MLLSLLSAPVAVFLPIASLIVPGLWAYSMRRTKPWYLMLYATLYALCASLLYGGDAVTTACLTGLDALVALAIYWGQVKRIGNAYTTLIAGGMALLSLYLCVCLPGILSGEGAFAAVKAAVNESAALLGEMFASVPSAPEGFAAYYQQQIDLVRNSVEMVVVPMLCIAAGVVGLSNLLFFRLFARKRTQEMGLLPLRPFRLWAIPRSMTKGMFFMLIGALVVLWIDWDYAMALSTTVNVMVGMPLALQGLCMIDFLIVRSGKNIATRRVLIYTLAAVALLIMQTPLVLLGCFDQIFQFRARAAKGPVTPPASPNV